MRSKTLAWLVLFVSTSCFAGTFIKEKGSQVLCSFELSEGPFEADQNVCLSVDSKKVACGKVMKTGKERVILKLTARKKGFQFSDGMELEIASGIGTGRAPGSVGESRLETSSRSRSGGKTFDVSLGASAGLTYLYPSATFQFALTNHFTIGLQPIWIGVSTNSTSLSAIGGLVALNLYFSQAYEGFFFQAAGGLLKMSLENSTGSVTESLTPVLASASLQYRLGVAADFDIGAGVGILWVMGELTNFNIGYTGLLPLFQAYVAYSF